jgi:hypothetical protein
MANNDQAKTFDIESLILRQIVGGKQTFSSKAAKPLAAGSGACRWARRNKIRTVSSAPAIQGVIFAHDVPDRLR